MLAKPLVWLLRQIIRWVGWPTLLSILLLWTALGSVSLGLTGIMRGFDTPLMLLAVGLGVLAGWVLARSPLPGWLAGLILLILGSEALLLRVGQLGNLLMTMVGSIGDLIPTIWRWPLTGPPNLTPLQLALAELWRSFNILLMRVIDWVSGLVTGQPTFDLVAATLVWGFTLWIVAAWAGWAVRRYQRPLLGVTPAGALLLISLTFAPTKVAAVPPLLGATLLLTALVKYEARERRWRTTGTDFPLDVRTEMAVTAIFLSTVLVTVATMSPALSVRQIARFTWRLIGAQVSQAQPMVRSLGLESSPAPASPLDKVRVGGLPRDHLLGSGPELSQQIVMVIRATEIPLRSPDEPPRYYWRSLTYDRYTGHGWSSGKTQTIAYEAGESVVVEDNAGVPDPLLASPTRRILRQDIQVTDDLGGLLFAAGELLTADQDFSVDWRGPGDIFGATIEAKTYTVESRLPLVNEADLRAVEGNYPEAIRQRYLRLPDDIPTRVLTLARDLTAIEPTPYDRAKAIESYLRTFPYTLDLPPPPRNRDIVDYFLFDLQQGYCDYYATSMVVLARAAGLPARLAIGYINGTYDAAEARYIVSEAEAHSWAEIYFPGYGWVNFEPTGGRPAIERLTEQSPPIPAELEAEPDARIVYTPGVAGKFWLWGLALPGSLALLALGSLVWSAVDGWRLRRLPPAEAISLLYQRLYQHSLRLHTPLEIGHTPLEFAAALVDHVDRLVKQRHWDQLVTPAGPEVQQLAELYVQTRYSLHRPVAADQIRAIQIWRKLHRRLWLAWVYLFAKRRYQND
jgi:transglutaminase-like putative cysteine protease